MVSTVALVQMNSGSDMAANVAAAKAALHEAHGKGTALVAFPENVFMMDEPKQPRILIAPQEHPGIAMAREECKALGCWALLGSVSVKIDDSGKTANRSLLIDDKGDIAAQYDKIHLFDVEVGDGQHYRESAKILPGCKAVTADSPFGKIGLSVCYDVRFPQLYRALAKAGAQILTVPSAFTHVTGTAHWHVLLRARAIENFCYVLAPAQCGMHPGKRQTYGHALAVDPWGKIIAEASEDRPEIVYAEIDPAQVAAARRRIPSLEHDREFTA